MFDKVLIANRGAIACRVIRTLKKLGVKSVAVYSDADLQSLHVAQADESVCIGPAPASESYLRAERILQVAREAGAQAIHPGYGFLSENADFAEACERDGIGMQLIWSDDELAEAFHSVERLASANFGNAGIFIEKYVVQARHVEVQVFGDGAGQVLALGERDCSVQRRNQKVIEETPAPNIAPSVRAHLLETAATLARAVNYRSAGTVEFVLDAETGAFHFLEVNTRLQVEHGVTEEVTGIDLVEWMVKLAAGDLPPLDSFAIEPRGASIQVRLYAEDPGRDFQPSSGVLTQALFPACTRTETWAERGTEISPFYDPMIAKIIVTAPTRAAAVRELGNALSQTQIAGVVTNVAFLRQVAADAVFAEGRQTTRFLNGFAYRPSTIEVLEPGVQTSIQDYPGRLGYWDVGVPPSGPMDPLALRLANRLAGNDTGTAALECTASGPTLKFNTDTTIAIAGAPMPATIDGAPIPLWRALAVKAGAVLKLGAVDGAGLRAYIAVAGGFDVPEYLGSRSTFTLGQFGGHAGRTIRVGDVLRISQPEASVKTGITLPAALWPTYRNDWEVGMLYGPHGAPDFFTDSDIDTFFSVDWEVHYNSSRTGVRLIGPKPQWARTDGGEAGLHPSNIHDNAYAIGAIDFTGDMPVILGPDGPSLGGFVCPAVVAHTELWKVGQLRPGDRVRFRRVSHAWCKRMEQAAEKAIDTLAMPPRPRVPAPRTSLAETSPILLRVPALRDRPEIIYRQSGDKYLLVEYGPLALDLSLRFRVHALADWVATQRLSGIIDLTPGIRSLQVHFDSATLPVARLIDLLSEAEDALPTIDDIEVPTHIVHLPLAWDDSQTRLATEK